MPKAKLLSIEKPRSMPKAFRWYEPDQPAGWIPSHITVHQTSRIVFFSHNKPAETVFFNQVSDERTGLE